MSFRRIIPTLLACCLLLGSGTALADSPTTDPTAAATTAPTTAPVENLATERQKNQDTEARDASDYPLLPPIPLDRLLQFRIEKGRLAILTRLHPTIGKSHVVVTDLPGICTIDVHSGTGDAVPLTGPYRPSIFMFERHDYFRPLAVDANTTVMVSAMNLQISQEIETFGGGLRQVSLVQTNPGFVDPNEPTVRLRVTLTGITGVPDVNLSCGADDFVTLRRLYRAQTARYLEPIFRELHAEADAFDADPRLAWQVFAATATADPAVAGRVQQLVENLDSDLYRTRESASAELHRMGQPAAVALEHMDRSHCSPEQNSRIDAFLSEYHPVKDDEADRLRNDPDFLLDCLYLDDPFIVHSSLQQLRVVTHRAVPFDATLRDEPRRSAIASLRDELAAPPSTDPASTPG